MKKSITLSKSDWDIIIEGLSYAQEQAEEEGDGGRSESYEYLINVLADELD